MRNYAQLTCSITGLQTLVMKQDSGRKLQFFIHHLHLMSLFGESLSEYCHKIWYIEKLELCGYFIVKNLEDMFTDFDRIRKCDKQTNRQMDRQTPHDGMGNAFAQPSSDKQINGS